MSDLKPTKLISNTIATGFPVAYLLRRLRTTSEVCNHEPLDNLFLRKIEAAKIEEFKSQLLTDNTFNSIKLQSDLKWYILIVESLIGTAKTLSFVLSRFNKVETMPEVTLCIARMLKDTHSFELSYKYCYLALQHNRQNICLLVLLGQVCDAMKRYDEAEAVFQQALKALIKPKTTYKRLTHAFEDLLTVYSAYCKHLFIMQQYEQVIYLIEQLSDISPDFVPDTELSVLWAECYRILGEVERSQAILTNLS